jgi:hypothetical protein
VVLVPSLRGVGDLVREADLPGGLEAKQLAWALAASTTPVAVVDMLLAARASAIGPPAFSTSTVGEIIRTPARTFEEWVRDNVAEFRA